MIIAACVRMAFCSFASLVGGTCGHSSYLHTVFNRLCTFSIKKKRKVVPRI